MAENVHSLKISHLFFAAFGKEVCACFRGGNNWTCGEIPQKKNGSGSCLSGMPLVATLKFTVINVMPVLQTERFHCSLKSRSNIRFF